MKLHTGTKHCLIKAVDLGADSNLTFQTDQISGEVNKRTCQSVTCLYINQDKLDPMLNLVSKTELNEQNQLRNMSLALSLGNWQTHNSKKKG